MLRYCDDEFTEQYQATIGLDFKVKTLDRNGRLVKEAASGMLIVYDVTSRDSFEKAKEILNNAKNFNNQEQVYAVVGNKSDLKKQRQISFEEGMSFANEIGVYFQETSAKEKYSLDFAFHDLALRCLKIYDDSGKGITDQMLIY
eukprot:403373104